jgi:hypothetical protein
VGEGQTTPSQGQEAEEAETEEGRHGPTNRVHTVEAPTPNREEQGPRKKVKASKLSIDPITLTEGDLHDIGETVRDVTNEALQDFMQENQIVLGALRAQLQELQVRPPQVGTLSPTSQSGSTAAEQMLRARMTKHNSVARRGTSDIK